MAAQLVGAAFFRPSVTPGDEAALLLTDDRGSHSTSVASKVKRRRAKRCGACLKGLASSVTYLINKSRDFWNWCVGDEGAAAGLGDCRNEGVSVEAYFSIPVVVPVTAV